MKTAVSSYSFSQYLNAGKMTLLDCIAEAKKMGFDGIEFTTLPCDDNRSDEEWAVALRKEAEKQGIAIVNYAVSANLLATDTEKEIANLKHCVDIAVLLGSPVMRHDVTWNGARADGRPCSFDTVLPILADGCRQVTEYAASKGVRTCSENHGFFAQDSERVEKLVNAVNHPNYGLLCDIGNFMCADENPATAVARVAPYAFHVHAKDFFLRDGMLSNPGECWFMTRAGNYLRGTIVGHGVVPVEQCLDTLKRAGYDGYVAVEFEGFEDALMGIRLGLEKLKKCL